MTVKLCFVAAVLFLNGCFSSAALTDEGNVRSRVFEAKGGEYYGNRYLQDEIKKENCTYFINSLVNFTDENKDVSAVEECNTKHAIGPPKCCTYDIANALLSGKGPFRVEYDDDYLLERGTKSKSENASICYAYVDQLQETICSQHQASFLTNTTFSVCKQSCDDIYAACVPTGIISQSFATDGTSFCEKAWSNGDQCEDNPYGYFCQQKIEIKVANATVGCAALSKPTEDVVDEYNSQSQNLDACVMAWVFLGMSYSIFLLVIVIIVISFVICCCMLCYCMPKKK